MAKDNLRSFRYSGEVANILEGFNGRSLNEKFENLVLHCFWEREKVEKDLARLRFQYAELDKLCQKKRRELMELDKLLEEKKQITGALTRLTLQIMDFKDKMDGIVTQSPGDADADRRQGS